MQHVVNKALTRWVAANLISGHLAHAGNHRHQSVRHHQGKSRGPKSADSGGVWGAEPDRGWELVHSLELDLYRSPQHVLAHTE